MKNLTTLMIIIQTWFKNMLGLVERQETIINKKYELLKTNKLLPNGQAALRVRRLSDGLLGGYVQGEHNLSQDGTCFIYDNAQVFDNACVYDNTQVFDDAFIYGTAKVGGNAKVYDNAQVCGTAWVYGNAQIYGRAVVYENAQIAGNARIYGNAQVFGNAHVYYRAVIHGDAKVVKMLFIQQFKHYIIVTNDYVFIGCEGHPHKVWEKDINKIGKRHGYTKTEINEVKEIIKVLKKQIKRKAKA